MINMQEGVIDFMKPLPTYWAFFKEQYKLFAKTKSEL